MMTTRRGARAAAPPPPLLCAALLWTAAAGQSPDGARPPASWQNPNLGVVADLVADAHDAAGPGSWRTEGLRVRAVEIDLSSSIDPHASLHVNVYAAPEGAELHEAYALFPHLPGGLKLKAGHMLANFGRWSRFHGHFMPFASEPRILHEYAGGGLLQTGAELSWLLPMNHYAEASIGVYSRIEGHSHDPDPPGAAGYAALAADMGCVPHGGHWDCPGDKTLYEDDLAALAGGDGMDPATRFSNRKFSELAYGARANTSFEFGPDWSLDAGTSAMFQPGHARSRRLHGKSYSKALLGADMTFFWHPLDRTRYRGLDFGAEALLNVEESDEALDSATTREFRAARGGAFAHARWRHTERWHFGGFGEAFQSWNRARGGDSFLKRRGGAFVTFNLTHYQFLRLEASRYETGKNLDPAHRILLQYDAVIGHHTHGVKR